MRKAFTMVELIMVIVVLGIIATIGTDIIASLYQNYIRTKAINRLESQTELVLEQVAKRLRNRVKNSTATIRGGNIVSVFFAQNTDTILTWVGISEASRFGNWDATANEIVPGWSGLVDYDSVETNATAKTIGSPGSRLDFAHSIVGALTSNGVSLMQGVGAKNPALIFKTPLKYNMDTEEFFNNTTNNYTLKVTKNGMSNTAFRITNDDNASNYGEANKAIFEQYYLSHSAYALVPEGDPNDFNLTLKYNYQPWEGESYADGSSAVLAENVSTFRFQQAGSTLRIKLCIHDNNQSYEGDFSACKETVVY